MLLNEAIKIRIDNLMKEKNIKSNYELSYNSAQNPSILNDFFRGRIAYPRIDTLYAICEGFNISLEEFFNDPLFDRENIEIEDKK